MTKRKKATSAASRTPRGGHLLDPQTAAPPARISTTLALSAECLVSDALRLKDSLAGLLDEPHTVTLDITALQRIDTAAVQVITAFVRDRAGHGRSVEWQGSAPALAAAAQLLGLTSLLRLPA